MESHTGAARQYPGFSPWRGRGFEWCGSIPSVPDAESAARKDARYRSIVRAEFTRG